MPQRSRLRRSSPPGGLTGPAPGTTIGNLDSARRARVDRGGSVAVVGAGWALDWWIGAEDRWHLPAQEAAVRQELVGASPVVATRVRIPGGDAVAHAYGARGPRGEDLVVMEVRNESPSPFALGLCVRARPGGRVTSLALQGSHVEVDGSPRLFLQRSPGRIALSTAAHPRDAGEVVVAGGAEPVRAHRVHCAEGDAQVVLLFPLAHTAALRVAMPLDDEAGPAAVEVTTLPDPPQVARGWATHSRGGARIEVPERRLREAVAAATRSLLLDGDGPLVARALGQLGFPAEAEARAPAAGAPLGDVLAARAEGWSLHRRALAEAEVPWLASVVERWAAAAADTPAEHDPGPGALPAIAELFDAAGEGRAAADVRALAADRPATRRSPSADLGHHLDAAGSTYTWPDAERIPDPGAAARFLLAVRAHLVDDRTDVVLSPVVPDEWLGQGWEVHDLPTTSGRLSFAIRWHGDRPALLWELDPHPGARAARLRCSLDPTWSTTEASGEALLAPVPVPERPARRRGLTIPVTIEPTRRGPA